LGRAGVGAGTEVFPLLTFPTQGGFLKEKKKGIDAVWLEWGWKHTPPHLAGEDMYDIKHFSRPVRARGG